MILGRYPHFCASQERSSIVLKTYLSQDAQASKVATQPTALSWPMWIGLICEWDFKESGQLISGLHCCQNSFGLLNLQKLFNTCVEMKLHRMGSEDPAARSSPLPLTQSPCASPSSVITLFTCCHPQSLSDPFPEPVQITNPGEKWSRKKGNCLVSYWARDLNKVHKGIQHISEMIRRWGQNTWLRAMEVGSWFSVVIFLLHRAH